MSLVPPAHPPFPPQVLAKPQLFRKPYKATSEILIAAKAALKVVVAAKVPEAAPGAALRAETKAVAAIANVIDVNEHDYVLANAPSPAMEVFVDRY